MNIEQAPEGAANMMPKGRQECAPSGKTRRSKRLGSAAELAIAADTPQRDTDPGGAGVMLPKGQMSNAPSGSLSAHVDAIVDQYRERCELVRARTALVNRIKALCRRAVRGSKCGGKKCTGLELCGRDMREADALYDALGGDGDHPLKSAVQLVGGTLFAMMRQSEDPIDKIERGLTARAAKLPVAEWIGGVSGVGMISLAKIIGEAGDLSRFSTHSKFWKWMGLAVIDGHAQRKHKDKMMAELHAFNPPRRSVVWNIGGGLMKAQIRKDKETKVRSALGPYGELYINRRAYLDVRDTEKWKELSPKEALKRSHAHAQRYIEKKFLRDLWNEWNRRCVGHGNLAERPSRSCPAAAE